MKEQIISILNDVLYDIIDEYDIDFPYSSITVDVPKFDEHGNYTTNLAMLLAKHLKKKPTKIAEDIVNSLEKSIETKQLSWINKIEIAGVGFINFFINYESLSHQIIQDIVSKEGKYGHNNLGEGQKVLIEFVSSNPTGPLHIGHGRGAAIGDSLTRLYRACGYNVCAEYYINDVGRQMDTLTLSIWLKYLQNVMEIDIIFPSKCYQGSYINDLALLLATDYGDEFKVSTLHNLLEIELNLNDLSEKKVEQKQEETISNLIAWAKRTLKDNYQKIYDFGYENILIMMQDDLSEFNVEFDSWFSEKYLLDSGYIEQTINKLKAKNMLYEQDGATWIKTSSIGDDKDRVICRSNGENTYFANDVAYHLNKFERGFDKLIDVLGSDHHGYVPRVRAALIGLGYERERFEVLMYQQVNLIRDGELVKMSTRAGNFVTLKSIQDELGVDTSRYYYIMRHSNQPIQFDVELAKSKSKDNPVYYVQYAHARICSILKKFDSELDNNIYKNYSYSLEIEQKIVGKLNQFPDIIKSILKNSELNLITLYLSELATLFHSYYDENRFLVDDNSIMQGRLRLCIAIKQVINNALYLIGVKPLTQM